MTLNDWVARWQIHPQALAELQDVLCAPAFPVGEPRLPPGSSEARAQQEIRLAASQRGLRLWRNNRGAVTTDDGRHIRFGLANDSTQMDAKIKSSDLVGITPVTIGPAHVGRVLGVFTSVEVKRPGWVYKGTDREVAQLAWLQAVVSLGGFALFATDPAHINGLE